MGIETSPDQGGSGGSFVSAIVAIEELAKIDPSVSVLCDVHNTLVNTVVRKYGTPEQQEKWLPQLAESKLGSFCLSETSSGSDAFALKTRAKKDGNNWIINGSKMWITNSYEAEIFLIFANVRPPNHPPGPKLIFHLRLTPAKDTRASLASSPPKIWASKSLRRSRSSVSALRRHARWISTTLKSQRRTSLVAKAKVTK